MSKFYTYVGQRRDNGGEVIHVGYKDGVRFEEAIQFKPMLGKRVKSVPGKEYLYTDMFGNPLQWKRFDSIEKYRNFIDEYDEVDFYGTMKEDYQFLSEEYPEKIDYELSMIRPFWIDIETKMITSNEEWAEVHDQPITSIAMKDAKGNKFFVMSTKMWSKEKSILPPDVVDRNNIIFYHCKDEEGIFKTLRKVLRREKPDMLIGFYSSMFDFPYIIKRGEYVMGKKFMKSFSEWQRVTCKKKVDRITGEIYDYFTEIQGTPLMDYQKMYKKFIYSPRESYSLDFLATAELGEAKLKYNDEYDNLDDLWDRNPQHYIDYNIFDVELLDLMDKKLGLVDLSCTIAYYAKTNFTDTLGTVGIWDSIFFNTLKTKNMMIPPKHGAEKEDYKGAAVFEPEKKIHNWLIAVDLNSLYPHIQQEYNISPESLVHDRRDMLDINIEDDLDQRWLDQQIPTPKDTIMAMNGCYFSKQEGIVPGLLREIYADRTIAKKKMLDWKSKLQTWKEENSIDNKMEFSKYTGDNKAEWAEMNKKISTYNNYQMAMKILMNSEYGALANVHFRYYDIRFASAITQCAQMALRWADKKLMEHPAQKKYKYYRVYGDTDSLYISVENVVKQIKIRRPDITDGEMCQQINGFVKKIIQPIISEGYEELARYVNANENRMFMGHEKTITQGMWVAKKMYALNVLWDEGVTYAEPKLKVKGIAVVRSSTPKPVRSSLKESIAIMLKDEAALVDYVKKQKNEWKDNDYVDIAFPRSANNIDKWMDDNGGYISRTPIAVRAAIVYNKAIKGDKAFPQIKTGEKIKYVYLRQPNPYGSNVIGFLRKLPNEAIKYIDWDLQFQKAYMAVIEGIYRNMGREFKPYKEVNLSDIF
jgi:DNA polymerase elongation subunit (family B)